MNIPANMVKVLIVIFAAVSMVYGIILTLSGVRAAIFAVDKATTNISVFLGTILIIVSAIGIYGAIMEHHYLLLAYMVIYATYFLMAFVLGIAILDSIPTEIHVKSEEILRQLYKKQYKDVTIMEKIKEFQRKFVCCGVYNRYEIDVRSEKENTYGVLIEGCCLRDRKYGECLLKNAFKAGCLSFVEKYQQSAARIAGTHLLVSAVFSLVILLLTGFLTWMVPPQKPAKPEGEVEEFDEYEEA